MRDNVNAYACALDAEDVLEQRRTHWRGMWCVVFLFVFSFLLYTPTIYFSFTLDDYHLITVNTRLSQWADVRYYFTHAHYWHWGYPTYYRPLVYLSLMLNYALSGRDPWSYHVFNIVANALVTVLVFLLMRHVLGRAGKRFSSRAAFWGALIFAAHPVHTEAVANVAGRADVMMTAWVLAGIVCGLSAAKGHRWAAWLGAVCACAAGLTKETGFLIAPLTFLVARTSTQRQSYTRRGLAHALTWQCIGTACALVLYMSAMALLKTPHTTSFLDNITVQMGLPQRILTAGMIIGLALRVTLLPVFLSADYSYAHVTPITTFLSPSLAFGVCVTVVLFVLCLRHPRTCVKKAVLWGYVWFIAAFILSSNMFYSIGTVFGERLVYLPSVGVCCALGVCVAYGTRRQAHHRMAVYCGGCLLVILFSIGTYARSQVWRSSETLTRSLLRSAPASAKAQYAAALLYLQQGEIAHAYGHVKESVRIYPYFPEAHAVYAHVYLLRGETNMAYRTARHAVELNPQCLPAQELLRHLRESEW